MMSEHEYMRRWYEKMTSGTPQSLSVALPEVMGQGQITQTISKQGVIVSDWRLRTHEDVRVQGATGGDYVFIAAAKKARCHDFIVGEGGATLSGGERQRISIARAILKDAPIVVLDEATASVDVAGERYIQEAISELVHNKTLLVIAHRLHTVRQAEQILVVDAGTIVQRGNHDALMACEGPYRDFVPR